MSTLARIHAPEEVIQNVDYGGDMLLRFSETVLKGGVEGAGECPGIHALAVMLHVVCDEVIILLDNMTGELFQGVGEISAGLCQGVEAVTVLAGGGSGGVRSRC